MQDVAELVEERLDLVVRQAAPIEVGHQHADRRAAGLAADAAHGPRRRVRELALARIEVEVDAADERARLRVVHVEVAHVLVPHRHLTRLEPQAVERAADVEQPVERRRRREILPQRFLIDAVALLAQPLAEKRHVPPMRRRRRCDGAPVARPSARAAPGGRVARPRSHGRPAPRRGIGPTASGVPAMRRRRTKCAKLGRLVEPGELAPQRDDLVEDLEIPRRAAIQVRRRSSGGARPPTRRSP